ncbi:hypothetical protein COCOBI_09-4230 [Coccomyxa sp. Obi]|nr:hypothetical protein COCOBI_09-4230 [Coccomyxa sp. Obi]
MQAQYRSPPLDGRRSPRTREGAPQTPVISEWLARRLLSVSFNPRSDPPHRSLQDARQVEEKAYAPAKEETPTSAFKVDSWQYAVEVEAGSWGTRSWDVRLKWPVERGGEIE